MTNCRVCKTLDRYETDSILLSERRFHAARLTGPLGVIAIKLG
jgi:hypothetical protein